MLLTKMMCWASYCCAFDEIHCNALKITNVIFDKVVEQHA